jgi:hypothetical protein
MKKIHRIAFLLIAAAFVLINTTCTIDSPLTAAIADKINEDLDPSGEDGTTVSVTGVSLDKESITIPVGATEQLTAAVEPADASDQSMSWSSDNEGVAAVDADGLVTGAAEGTATVTVTTTDGGFTASCSVTVVTNTVTYHPNGGTAGTAPTDSTDYSSGDTVTVLGNTGNLVGALVGGDHTGSGIKQRFVGWNTNSGATTAEYVAGDTFTITENTTLYAIYTTGTDVLQKVGPAGGWVFYDAGSTQSWGRYLEAAPESSEWPGEEWGDYGTEIGGDAQLTGIGDGQAATDAIVAHMESKSITGTAAQVCDNHEPEYDGTIYDDWFLPSKDELNTIWENIVDDGDGNNSGAGGFADGYYWSSSEYDTYSAWTQLFSSGFQGDYDKTSYDSVRAVRAF